MSYAFRRVDGTVHITAASGPDAAAAMLRLFKRERRERRIRVALIVLEVLSTAALIYLMFGAHR